MICQCILCGTRSSGLPWERVGICVSASHVNELRLRPVGGRGGDRGRDRHRYGCGNRDSRLGSWSKMRESIDVENGGDEEDQHQKKGHDET